MLGPRESAAGSTQPFSLLAQLFGDRETATIFGRAETIRRWVEVEVALAAAQADCGLIEREDAANIARAAESLDLDEDRFWREARVVGYPILPLVEELVRALPEGAEDRVHFGATTQDIMDTGLILQTRAAVDRLETLICHLGAALRERVERYAATPMAGRTHAQQAVPTTFGAKLATFLDELTRHLERLGEARSRVLVISLHGAAGTSAASGPDATAVRAALADALGLTFTDVPWHASRDRLAELSWLAAAVAETCARLAREVVDLSRTEIAEVAEGSAHHGGASSTMPQKRNPVRAEAIIGFAGAATALAPAQLRAVEAGHERSAGEWQIEWQVFPQALFNAASALAVAGELVEGLTVDTHAMLDNLTADNGAIMAEAMMMSLAREVGRNRAHDLVYKATGLARERGIPVQEALAEVVGPDLRVAPIAPAEYLGDADRTCRAAIVAWERVAGHRRFSGVAERKSEKEVA
jgi:3-carboxy-cis,cis-muconate cycloisomerase